MIGGHPGGISLTKRLLELDYPGSYDRVLDMGMGQGETVSYLCAQGYKAEGVDINHESPGNHQDMTELPYDDEIFDLCLAECSISVCQNGKKALNEAFRVLKPGGALCISDVFFRKDDAPTMSMEVPLTLANWTSVFVETGFKVEDMIDESALWKEYFLEQLWKSDEDAQCLDLYSKGGKAGCGYFLARLRKGGI